MAHNLWGSGFLVKVSVRKLSIVKSLLSELVGSILRKEKLANAFTSDIIAGEIATIVTDLCQQKILKDQVGRLTFEKILDDEIQNVSRDVLEVEKSESEKSTLKNLKLGEMKKRHDSCCQNERLRRRSCDAFRNGIRILNESFSGSWISSQTDFDDLSLEAKCIIVSRELLSRDKMAKMTSADVADLDLKQEDYEIFYRFPQLARDSTPARSKGQKSDQEPAKKKIKKTEKIKTSVKSHSTRVIGSDSLDSIIKHQSPPAAAALPSKKVIQLPKKTNSKFSKVPKLSDLKRMRAQVFYDEDIEEAFTHRDSKNQRVDDVIEILSSDDDIIPVQEPPTKPKPKPKKSDESKNPFFKYYIKEIRDDLIESVLRVELTSALESELLYFDLDLDPASPDIEISEEVRHEEIPSVTKEQKESIISQLSESTFESKIESLVVPEMMKQLATNFLKEEKSRRSHLLKTMGTIMDPVLSEIIREELTFRIISERNRKQTRIRVLFVDQLRSSLIQDFVSTEVRNFLDAEIREKKKTEAIQEEKEILINETLFEVRVVK